MSSNRATTRARILSDKLTPGQREFIEEKQRDGYREKEIYRQTEKREREIDGGVYYSENEKYVYMRVKEKNKQREREREGQRQKEDGRARQRENNVYFCSKVKARL